MYLTNILPANSTFDFNITSSPYDRNPCLISNAPLAYLTTPCISSTKNIMILAF